MRQDPSDVILFLGRFHPLLVHLPIGVLVLLGVLEVAAGLTRWKEAASNRVWILGFGGGAAVGAALCGWMLGLESGYDPQLLRWHRALGLATAAACVLTLWLSRRKQLGGYRLSLATTLLLLGVASHLGGSITHGRDFLTRYAPKFLHALMRREAVSQAKNPESLPQSQQPVFTAVVQPVLKAHCTACHGGEKHKADLRLDNLEGLLQGGQNGPAIRPGQARNSPMIQRMLLSPDADGHMPPEDTSQPTHEEIALLEWWIDAGASATQSVSDLRPEPRIRRILEVVSTRLAPAR